MKRGAALALLGCLLAASCTTRAGSGTDPATSDEPSYLTLLFGRALWEPAVDCEPVRGGVSLDRVAQQLKVRGLAATASVVTGRTGEASRQCEFTVMSYASWADLDRLRTEFGWTAVSNGATHQDITGMDRAGQVAESCGTLRALEDHGHDRAWGLFGYGNDKRDTGVQRDVVATCFAFGRRYSTDVNRQSTAGAPWFQNTFSVESGMSVDRLARAMSPRPGEWRVVQVYRLVEGRRETGKQQWDCEGSGRHSTSRTELYCFTDFLAAVDRIPDGVIVTDPATVAEAWGRPRPRPAAS